jgi:hypothetical protein
MRSAGIGCLVDAEQVADALDGGVGIGLGVFRQKLALVQRAVGRAANDIGEGAATVDPEIPNSPVMILHASRDCQPWCPRSAAWTPGCLRIMPIVGITSIIYR